MKTPCFTLHYAAPEVLQQAAGQADEGYDETCDLWSLGVVLVSRVLNSVRVRSPMGLVSSRKTLLSVGLGTDSA